MRVITFKKEGINNTLNDNQNSNGQGRIKGKERYLGPFSPVNIKNIIYIVDKDNITPY